MNLATLLAATAEQIEAEWADSFFGLNQEQRFVVMIVAIACATGIVISAIAIVTGIVSSVHRRRLEADLKREMLDRGMSAGEVARIVESAPPQSWLDRWASSQKKD